MIKSNVQESDNSPGIKNLSGQVYVQNRKGQLFRLDSNGEQIPRIRMSKKKRLELRKDMRKTKLRKPVNSNVEYVAAVPVVNPKSEKQLDTETEKVEGDA
jgi:hypothetical protein